MVELLYYIGAGVLGIIFGYYLPKKKIDNRALHLIIKKLNRIIMTQSEATTKINALTTQLGKVKTEVEALIAAVQNTGNVTPELETAIANAETALAGVDDLNPDAPPPTE